MLFFTSSCNSFRTWIFVDWEMNPFQGHTKATLAWDGLTKIKNKNRKHCFCEIVHFLTVAFQSFKNKPHQIWQELILYETNSRTLFQHQNFVPTNICPTITTNASISLSKIFNIITIFISINEYFLFKQFKDVDDRDTISSI